MPLIVIATLTGLWDANAPRWIVAMLILWWAGLLLVFVVLQKKEAEPLQATRQSGGQILHTLATPGNRITSTSDAVENIIFINWTT